MQANVEQSFESIERVEATFQVGDMAVHPAHGVGAVTGIEKRDLGGIGQPLLCAQDHRLRAQSDDPRHRDGPSRVTPCDEPKGSRQSPAYSSRARGRGRRPNVEPTIPRVHRYVEERLSLEIAKVLRDMYRLKFDKNLSFGERRLLDQAKSLLVNELALAKQISWSPSKGRSAQIFTA